MTESRIPAPLPDLQGKPPLWQRPWFNTLGRFAALIAVFLLFCLLVEKGKFYSVRNLESILRQSAVYATAALGMTLVIIAAGIDLSVGSMIALAAVMVAWTLNLNFAGAEGETIYLIDRWPVMLPILAVAAALATGTAAGALNGCTIVYLRLVPFIVTLGTMGIFRGLAKGIAEDKSISPKDGMWVEDILEPTLSGLATELGKPAEIRGDLSRYWTLLPPGVWMLIVAAVFAALLLRYTRFGRHVFAIGSNEETARLCGVPVARTKIVVYALAGFFAGLAGVMQFSFTKIGSSTTAIAYELHVIAAVVIGGGSLRGGEGSILGSLIGALVITVLSMGGQQAGWPKWVQEVVIGAIIIAAVALDQLRHRRLG